jgi:pyruvate-ferredoxin/flavodoxin oxidoreductase
MQGNAFLGAFFAVSSLLNEFGITPEQYREVVYKQYVKKFGKLGDAVVASNMEVMTQGAEQVKEIKIGALSAADRSTLRGQALLPILELATAGGCSTGCRSTPIPAGQGPRTPISSVTKFDAEFRSTFGYNQPATPLSAMGVIAAATGDTASKYVARRETPLYIPENCTQCMECISVCPDTALPNTSQDLSTLLTTAVSYYVADGEDRTKLLRALPQIEKAARQRMVAEFKTGTPLPTILRDVTDQLASDGDAGFSQKSKQQFFDIIAKVPMAYQKVNAIFSSP